MAGRRKHIELCLTATGIRTPLDSLHQVIVDAYGNAVGILVVVAEERGVVADVGTDLFPSPPVLCTGLKDFVHRVAMVFEYVLLQGCETVGNRTKTRTLDISRVITGTATVIVLTLLDAVVDV